MKIIFKLEFYSQSEYQLNMKETGDIFRLSGPLGVYHPGSLSQEALEGMLRRSESVNRYKGGHGTWETGDPMGDRGGRESSR